MKKLKKPAKIEKVFGSSKEESVFDEKKSDLESEPYDVLSDYEDEDVGIQVAYLLKDKEGYDYIEDIEDAEVLKAATEAVKEIIKVIG